MIQPLETVDVVVIGAGPSGAVSSALLQQKGYKTVVLEKEYFPRFSIGESLLPQSMAFLEEAGMLPAVEAQKFQFKNGAAFLRGDEYDYFDFREKFTEGWGTTFQVQRGTFDQVLSQEAEKQGVNVRHGHTVTAFHSDQDLARLEVTDESGAGYQIQARFVLDGSGFGRVLPRLLGLESPSELANRISIFTHIEDRISADWFDRDKILITVHPEHHDVWYWLIPFSNGRCSIGVVAPKALMNSFEGDLEAQLKTMIAQSGKLSDLVNEAIFDTRFASIEGYSCDVKSLYGDKFALLGNAGEFLDPVFSSGITIALKSASLAAKVVDMELSGGKPDWEQDYSAQLKLGVNTFRTFVDGWYDTRLQDVIFASEKSPAVKEMISSILAGYAWDQKNPYVKDHRRLTTLAELCRTA
jgi:flavin-dependent dehydrogenase